MVLGKPVMHVENNKNIKEKTLKLLWKKVRECLINNFTKGKVFFKWQKSITHEEKD